MSDKTVYAFTLKTGETLDCTVEELAAKGYKDEDVAKRIPLYQEGDEKLTANDINDLLNASE